MYYTHEVVYSPRNNPHNVGHVKYCTSYEHAETVVYMKQARTENDQYIFSIREVD